MYPYSEAGGGREGGRDKKKEGGKEHCVKQDTLQSVTLTDLVTFATFAACQVSELSPFA